MTNLIRLILAAGLLGHADSSNVLLINDTGLRISRIVVGTKTYEDVQGREEQKILIAVAPGKHHLELLFRGGARIDWDNFDFTGLKSIRFDLEGSSVIAHPGR